MSDSYQAIYDAVRGKLSNADVGSAIENAIRCENIAFYFDKMANEFSMEVAERTRPSAIFKPSLTLDGDTWIAIYGDLATGVVGCGKCPHDAMIDFDASWHKSK